MRVLFAVHHPLDDRLGAPGASMAVGEALARLGHHVEFVGYDTFYPRTTEFGPRHQVAFPWRLAGYLRANPGRFDIVDATTGDGYVWSTIGRPTGDGAALVTRSNGLERLASEARRAESRAGTLNLSWKYGLYHGGFRLWEVDRSLEAAEGVLLLSAAERACDCATGTRQGRVGVIPHGLRASLLEQTRPQQPRKDGDPVRLCFVGNWHDGKGIDTLTRATLNLAESRTPFELLVAGSGVEAAEVIRDFAPATRSHVRVVPRFSQPELNGLLEGQEIFIMPSRFEGFGMAILEAMSGGLAPIVTPVGLVPETIKSWENGVAVPHHRPDLIASAVRQLLEDPAELLRMRQAAWRTAQGCSWDATASRTLDLYRRAHDFRSAELLSRSRDMRSRTRRRLGRRGPDEVVEGPKAGTGDQL